MVLDYSGRRPVTKNRPRKQPVGIFAVILISAISMSFALGVLSGWFIFRPSRKSAQSQSAPGGAKGAPSALAPQAVYPNPEASAAKGADPPLTFYETLPKGGKAIIGSGLNPKKGESTQPAKRAPVPPSAPPQQTAAQPPAKPDAGKTEERKEPGTAAADQAKKTPAGDSAPAPKQPGTPGKFCVQVASTQERKEAEALKARLTGKGLPAYILESNLKEKGTWFRIRVGKHLSQQAAGDLAGKAGKGAMVVPE
jgi:cell division septation protein DedD